VTRSQERQVLWLERVLDDQRKEWLRVHGLLEAEEKRLLQDPAATLRFT
jgi:hypothetical protein